MSGWFYKCTADPTDLSPLVDAVAYFEDEYKAAQPDLEVRGLLEREAARIPGITEYRYSQLQELEALVRWLDDELKRVRFAAFKKYFESYERTLTSRDAQFYADADDKVLEMSQLHNQVRLTRDKFVGILKALETKQYQINNVIKLRQLGLDDAEIDYS